MSAELPNPIVGPAVKTDQATPEISVVVPLFNEEAAVASLALEIVDAFSGLHYEILFVDDASRDGTQQALSILRQSLPQLRVLVHQRNAGQSRAVRSGVMAALAPIVVTLDGDGQNDPHDAPGLVRRLAVGPANLALVGGRRVKRRDRAAKRWASAIANAVRKRVLDDRADDTACGLKAFRRDAFLSLPYFDHMHRYLPALMLREGFDITFQDVSHRARSSGASKYTNLGRFWAALSDLGGVVWLRARARTPGQVRELS